MRLICVCLLILALATPAWAISDAELLRQASRFAGEGTVSRGSGRAPGSASCGTWTIRDASGHRVGTMEPSRSGWTVRNASGRRVGTIAGR